MHPSIRISFAALAACVFIGCKNWNLDYGTPDAQFNSENLVAKAKPFLGRHVTIKGKVTATELSDPKAAWVHLEGGIHCNLGHLTVMASSYKPGETVYIDGYLKRCEEGDVVLDPAVGRDPTAPFSPQ